MPSAVPANWIWGLENPPRQSSTLCTPPPSVTHDEEDEVEAGEEAGAGQADQQHREEAQAANAAPVPLGLVVVAGGEPRHLHRGGEANGVKGHADGVGRVEEQAHAAAKLGAHGPANKVVGAAASHHAVGDQGRHGQHSAEGLQLALRGGRKRGD